MCESTAVQEIRKLFDLICSVPHGPGNEQQLSDKVCERLYENGLTPEQDAHGNIICDIPGTADGPLVALQAHLDMVCAVGSPDYHPLTDPIRPITRDGWICTAGESSLGADCGAGAAAMLRIALHDELRHPPLRLIFTVAEEVGLQGANKIDPACMKDVSCFINLDGFCFGRAVIGAAGGARLALSRPIETEAAPADLPAYRVTLSGLVGGHSGADIDKNRANAIEQLGLALQHLAQRSTLRLSDIRCGTAFNSIPTRADCTVVTDGDPRAWLAEENARLALVCGASEPDARFTLTPCEPPAAVYTESLSRSLIELSCSCPSGVYLQHAIFPTVTGDSCNFGVLRADKDRIVALAMTRFSTPGAEAALSERFSAAAARCGFSFTEEYRYPDWPCCPDSMLVRHACACYEQVTGRPLAVEAYHVGLEPAIFHSYNPAAQFITLGMTIENCHSPAERWQIDTIAPFATMLDLLLAALCEP